jgi:hypothetical protein
VIALPGLPQIRACGFPGGLKQRIEGWRIEGDILIAERVLGNIGSIPNATKLVHTRIEGDILIAGKIEGDILIAERVLGKMGSIPTSSPTPRDPSCLERSGPRKPVTAITS